MCGSASVAQRPEWREACQGGGIVARSDLTPLRSTVLPHGVAVDSASLRIFLTAGVGMRVGLNPCQTCVGWTPSRTLAFHCLNKLPECLNLTGCACLRHHRARGDGTSAPRAASSQAGAGAYHAAAQKRLLLRRARGGTNADG